jgi:hypothetical protein
LRKLFIGAVVGVLALAVAAVAFGATTQTYKQTFTTPHPAKSSAISFSTDSTDTANTANNNQPKSVRTFKIKFPSGSAVDTKGTTECKASNDAIFQAGGKPACPKSVIGAGNALVRTPFPGQADITATITVFAAAKGLILYVEPSLGQPLILRPKFSGNLKNGPTLTTIVPPNCVPPAIDQGGQCKKQDGSAGQEFILTHFALKTVAKKKGKHVLIKTPKKCKGTWKSTATLSYADGTSKKIDSLQACKKK